MSTRQSPIGWLNDEAIENIQLISVTLAAFHSPSGWLKAEASVNIITIVLTPEVSHAPMFSSKDAAPEL